MKLGEGGEAFFVFETSTSVPAAMQTSPVISPLSSPEIGPSDHPTTPPSLENDPLELTLDIDNMSLNDEKPDQSANASTSISVGRSASFGTNTDDDADRAAAAVAAHVAGLHRANTDHGLPAGKVMLSQSYESSKFHTIPVERPASSMSNGIDRPSSPIPLSSEEAKTRAINLSKKLWGSNIPSQVTDQGDLMLDMTGYKSSEEESLRAEVIARKILTEELEGDYDIGSLMGSDDKGNLWIYSSEEAKEQASRKLATSLHDFRHLSLPPPSDAVSDPGYQSDDARSETSVDIGSVARRFDADDSIGLSSPPLSDELQAADSRNFAKTLRLTSDQLKHLNLKSGQNSMAFTVNRATCTASLWLWKYDVPIIISDIDGTITKSDALGHVLNMIGRDWTHLGVAKLYTEIAANGYNFLYLTSRSVGHADTTRAYLNGVLQEGGYKLPRGPTIMSPDRTMAALKREVYLRKPEVFKMSCLRDIMALFSGTSGSRNVQVDQSQMPARAGGPFYAGFGNRLTDAISYRCVNIPSTRIFTINSSSEVSLDLVSLSKFRTGYSSMRDIVDQFFPPVGLLVKGGGEAFTDFNYWREKPFDIDQFSGSESDEDEDEMADDEDDDEIDEEATYDDERSFAIKSPLFTPGVMSDEEYAALSDSIYSTSAAENGASLAHSLLDEAPFGVTPSRRRSSDENRTLVSPLSPSDREDIADQNLISRIDHKVGDGKQQKQNQARLDLQNLAKVLSSPTRQTSNIKGQE